MPIAITHRKNVKAKALATSRPDLTPKDIAKLVGMTPGSVARAVQQETFGRQKPKSRAR